MTSGKLAAHCVFSGPWLDERQRTSMRKWRLNLLTTAAGKLFLAVGNEIHVRDTMLLEPVHLDPQPGSTAVSPSPTLILSHPMPVDARPIEATDAYPSPINALRSGWLGEEEIVVSVDDGGQACIWFARDPFGSRPVVLQHAFKSCWGVAMHGPRRLIAVSSNSYDVAVWRLPEDVRNDPQGTMLTSARPTAKVFRGHAHNIPSVDFSPDGRFLASCSVDGTYRVWNVDTGATIASRSLYQQEPVSQKTWAWCVRFIDKRWIPRCDEDNRNVAPPLPIADTDDEEDPLYESEPRISADADAIDYVSFLEDRDRRGYSDSEEDEDDSDYRMESIDGENDSDVSTESDSESDSDMEQGDLDAASMSNALFPFDIPPLLCTSQADLFGFVAPASDDVSSGSQTILPNVTQDPVRRRRALNVFLDISAMLSDFTDQEVREMTLAELRARWIGPSPYARVSFMDWLCGSQTQTKMSSNLHSPNFAGCIVVGNQDGHVSIVRVSQVELGGDNGSTLDLRPLLYLPDDSTENARENNTEPYTPLSLLGMCCVPVRAPLVELAHWRVYMLLSDGRLEVYTVFEESSSTGDGKNVPATSAVQI